MKHCRDVFGYLSLIGLVAWSLYQLCSAAIRHTVLSGTRHHAEWVSRSDNPPLFIFGVAVWAILLVATAGLSYLSYLGWRSWRAIDTRWRPPLDNAVRRDASTQAGVASV